MQKNYEQWLEQDPDPADRQALQLQAADPQQQTKLQQIFSAPLSFGTAGLRGEMGPGPGRMNTAVIRRATYGLAQVLGQHLGSGFRVVIGFDARHRSRDFATETARVMAAAGGSVQVLQRPAPTPLLAFALRDSGADCGIMITASHNPASDNGYKVYLGGRLITDWGQGAQLISPWDKHIMEAISQAPPAKQIPLSDDYSAADSQWETRYRQRARQLIARQGTHRNQLKIVLTSLHGVGAELCETVLGDAGFTQLHPVLSQREPDPDFPTVNFPNPEEAGALDLAIQQAQQIQAHLIIANDPDADRCSAAIPQSGSYLAPNGSAEATESDESADTAEAADVAKAATPADSCQWRQLTGDEVGALLGWFSCHQAPQRDAAVARSIVSGELLDRIAQSFGVKAQVTLTGFKWIARTPDLIFGYEEALGNCVDPNYVRDKDGITAALCLSELAANLSSQGKTLQDLLDDLALKHGLYVTTPLTFRVTELSQITEGMKALRRQGLTRLGTETVSFSLDLQANQPDDPSQTAVGARWEDLSQLPPTDALFFGTDSGSRVVVRPSGTEPKLKCYLQCVQPVSHVRDLFEARHTAEKNLEIMKSQLRQALGFE